MIEKIKKEEILDALIKEIETELNTAVAAARTAEIDATNEESRPENEYDTRALEASYVARGQAKRVAELKETLFEVRHLKPKKFGPQDPITSTALIELDHDGQTQYLFFAPLGGGFQVVLNGIKIQVITPSTPLGQSLLQAKEGDDIIIQVGQNEREYQILKVY